MRVRYLHIVTILTRLAASTLFVSAALVAGMMTFPTTCECGADRPHDHPLFGVAGHRHGDQRTNTSGPDTEYIRAGADGVTVQASTGSSAPSMTAIHTADAQLQALPRASMPADAVQLLDGMSATPDLPPPQA